MHREFWYLNFDSAKAIARSRPCSRQARYFKISRLPVSRVCIRSASGSPCAPLWEWSAGPPTAGARLSPVSDFTGDSTGWSFPNSFLNMCAAGAAGRGRSESALVYRCGRQPTALLRELLVQHECRRRRHHRANTDTVFASAARSPAAARKQQHGARLACLLGRRLGCCRRLNPALQTQLKRRRAIPMINRWCCGRLARPLQYVTDKQATR